MKIVKPIDKPVEIDHIFCFFRLVRFSFSSSLTTGNRIKHKTNEHGKNHNGRFASAKPMKTLANPSDNEKIKSDSSTSAAKRPITSYNNKLMNAKMKYGISIENIHFFVNK